MNKQTHLTDKDLLSAVKGNSDAALTAEIEAHLTECPECRNRLESLAAEPKLWNKAASILTEEHIGETIAFHSRIIADSKEARRFDLKVTNESAPVGPTYKVEDLVEPPRHPEMLGRLEHYEIEREVGRGGMGVVVKAFDTELNRAVAIKLMAPHLATHGVARQRFSREARAAAAILHPNVIAIHGVSTESATPWLVMPYIVGPSLEQIVSEKGALDEKDLVCFAMQIASGLQAAHAQGVVHRDIKPANVLIESGMGRVVITDFGLARAECDASMTQTGWFAGTPNFMSPEQARGVALDHRSDLFSLGSVMYYMATGKLPFRAEQTMAIFERIREHHPAPVRRSNPSISKPISNLIEILLAKEPSERVQTAGEVHQVLEQYLAHLHHPDAKQRPVVKPPKRRTSKPKTTSLIWLPLVAVIAAVCGWLVLPHFFQPNEPADLPETQLKSTSVPRLSFDEVVAKHQLIDLGLAHQQMNELNSDLSVLERELQMEESSSAVFGLDSWPGMEEGLSRQINAFERELEVIDLHPRR